MHIILLQELHERGVRKFCGKHKFDVRLLLITAILFYERYIIALQLLAAYHRNSTILL